LPSQAWIDIFKSFEPYFQEFYKRLNHAEYDVNRTQGVCQLASEVLISKYPDVPVKVIQFFIKFRTILRVKSINKELAYMRKWKSNSYVPKPRTNSTVDVDLTFEDQSAPMELGDFSVHDDIDLY